MSTEDPITEVIDTVGGQIRTALDALFNPIKEAALSIGRSLRAAGITQEPEEEPSACLSCPMGGMCEWSADNVGCYQEARY